MTEAQAKALVASLAAAFPRQRIPGSTLNVYVHDLADLDFELAKTAIETLRRGSKFMPTIAEIRETVAELLLGAPTPMAAWEQAHSPAGQRHKLVDQAQRMVGDAWHWRETELAYLRRPFLEAYAEVRAEAMREIVQPELAAARQLAAAAVRELPSGSVELDEDQLPLGDVSDEVEAMMGRLRAAAERGPE